MSNHPDAPKPDHAGTQIAQVEKSEITVSPSQPGAIYKPVHTTRAVKIYPIQEHELENISDLNNDSTFWATVSGAALWMITDRLWDWFILSPSEKITPQSITCVVIAAVVSFLGAGKAFLSRRKIKTRLKKILEECGSNG